MTSTPNGYWSRSWALLTRDKGWIKPLLMLGAARLIPIVGPMGADGYGLEWARLTAWGVDSAPKQKNVDIGACILAGARAFVVGLCYGIGIGLITGGVHLLLGEVIGGTMSFVFGIFLTVLMTVIKLRTTIYQQISAGFELDRISDMIGRDGKGLLSIVGMNALIELAFGFVGLIVVGGLLLTSMGGFMVDLVLTGEIDYVDDAYIVAGTLAALASILPFIFVFSYLGNVARSFADLMVKTAVGLWMRQFDVRNWGASSDPLPSTAPGGSSGAYNASGAYDGPGAYGGPYANEPYAGQTTYGQPNASEYRQPYAALPGTGGTQAGQARQAGQSMGQQGYAQQMGQMPTATPTPQQGQFGYGAPQAQPQSQPYVQSQGQPYTPLQSQSQGQPYTIAPQPVVQPIPQPRPIEQPQSVYAQTTAEEVQQVQNLYDQRIAAAQPTASPTQAQPAPAPTQVQPTVIPAQPTVAPTQAQPTVARTQAQPYVGEQPAAQAMPVQQGWSAPLQAASTPVQTFSLSEAAAARRTAQSASQPIPAQTASAQPQVTSSAVGERSAAQAVQPRQVTQAKPIQAAPSTPNEGQTLPHEPWYGPSSSREAGPSPYDSRDEAAIRAARSMIEEDLPRAVNAPEPMAHTGVAPSEGHVAGQEPKQSHSQRSPHEDELYAQFERAVRESDVAEIEAQEQAQEHKSDSPDEQ